jgi:exopolysaccharide biosynthesis polyprenyl glycosylphosphotransferase
VTEVPTTTLRRGRAAERQARARPLHVVDGATAIRSARVRRGIAAAVALVVAGDAIVLGVGLARSHEASNWIYAAFALTALMCAGTYHLRFNLSALDEAPRLAGALAIAVVGVAPFAGSHSTVLMQAALTVPAIVIGRALTYSLLRVARCHGLSERTLIAGSGHVAIEIAQLIENHPEFGLSFVGFAGEPFPDLPGPLLGELQQLDEIVTRHAVPRVIVAFGPTREAELVTVLRTAMLRAVQVHVVPRFFDVGVAPRGPDTDDLWGIPLYRIRQAALQRWAWRFKRLVDVVLSSLLLVLTAPVMLLAAVAVRLSGKGPILFRQPRIGQYGNEIEVFKFRTLPADFDSSVWVAESANYSKIGWILRRCSIDELPQLWNVLRGDMSLVGPRPERGHMVEAFNDKVYGYRDRHRLPVGITGWAQIHGLRGDTSLRERARFDNQYIEHWSLWRDVVVLLRTFGAVFRGPHRASAADAHSVPNLDVGVTATTVPLDDGDGSGADAAQHI